jgi:D-alanyl-D-alanine carboxypeptidase (penicillin-binding protein 5/6)
VTPARSDGLARGLATIAVLQRHLVISPHERTDYPLQPTFVEDIGRSSRFRESRTAVLTCLIALALMATAMFPQQVGAAQLATDRVDGAAAAKLSAPISSLPDVDMAQGALVDSDGRVLWSRSAGTRRPMASITKIMTAVVALENSSLDEVVTIPKASVAVGESSASLRTGERLPMRDMLAALLVKSGNDAAVAIAQHVGGTEAHFVEMMNAKAAELGLSNTHFANPHGLDAPGHYTTASDLGVLARYAMSKPEFSRIVSLKSVTIGSGKRRETLTSTDELLGNYRGAMGVKTGFTNGAGYSVVSAAQRNGLTLYAIVLGTKSDLLRFREAKTLLDWGFAHYRPMSIATAGTVVGEAPVKDYLDVTVPAAVSKDTTLPVLDLNGTIVREVQLSEVSAPVAVGQTVGVATFKQGGKTILTLPLVATQAVKRPNPFEFVWIAVIRLWRRVVG